MQTIGHDHILETAADWHHAGRGAVLATVIETWGSAPRPVGAQLAVSGDAQIMGSVSGGCVEGAVVAEALETLETGTCRVLEFGVADEDAFAVGLACGGKIRVLVEPVGIGQGIARDMLETIIRARAERAPIGVEVHLRDWSRRLIAYADARSHFDQDRSAVTGDGDVFVWVNNPPLRLVIIGAVHIAQPLADMAVMAGYDITLVDPREAFANPERFPGYRLSHDWPDAALKAHGLDARTAVVALTHDPKFDDPALHAALNSPAFYIGALGSTRTHAKRVERLKNMGLSPDIIARLDAPIGLDIGAKSPAEIAVAIMAELTQRLRRPDTRPGRMP